MTRYAKALVAVVGAVSAWATTYFPADAAVQKWVGLAVALVTAVSVFAVPNQPPKGKPRRHDMSEQGEAGAVALVVLLVILAAIFLGVVAHPLFFLLLVLALLLIPAL